MTTRPLTGDHHHHHHNGSGEWIFVTSVCVPRPRARPNRGLATLECNRARCTPTPPPCTPIPPLALCLRMCSTDRSVLCAMAFVACARARGIPISCAFDDVTPMRSFWRCLITFLRIANGLKGKRRSIEFFRWLFRAARAVFAFRVSRFGPVGYCVWICVSNSRLRMTVSFFGWFIVLYNRFYVTISMLGRKDFDFVVRLRKMTDRRLRWVIFVIFIRVR